MRLPLEDLYRIAPELVLCTFGIVIMLVDPFVARKRAMGWVAFIGTLAALGSIRCMMLHPGPAYSGLIRADDFSIFLHGVVVGVAALVILGSFGYLDREQLERG